MSHNRKEFIWVRKYSTGVQLWNPKQIVWAKRVDQPHWYPGVIICPEDGWYGWSRSIPCHTWIYWFDSGTISQVSESDVRDFCQSFKSFSDKIPSGGLIRDRQCLVPRSQVLVASCVRYVMNGVGLEPDYDKESQEIINWANKHLQQYEGVCVDSERYRVLRAKFDHKMGRNTKPKDGESLCALDLMKDTYDKSVNSDVMVAKTTGVSGLHQGAQNEFAFGGRLKRRFKMDKLVEPLNLGWKHLVSLRQPGGSKFGDVYYFPPDSRVQLRSIVNVAKYMHENKDKVWVKDMTSQNFSFFAKITIEHENEKVRNAGEKLDI